jgi:hypothetical protein
MRKQSQDCGKNDHTPELGKLLECSKRGQEKLCGSATLQIMCQGVVDIAHNMEETYNARGWSDLENMVGAAAKEMLLNGQYRLLSMRRIFCHKANSFQVQNNTICKIIESCVSQASMT